MNRNLKQSVWVLALGIAFTGLSTSRLTAAAPAQQDQGRGQDQDQDQNRNENRDRNNNNQFADRGYFQQGVLDGQHDRQFGGNRNDHQQPSNKNDRRTYQDGYKQGFKNAASYQQNDRSGNVSYFDQGLRDGQHDRQYGSNRSYHQQPRNGNDRRAYQDGYKQGYGNTAYNQENDRSRNVNYFDQGLRDGQSDRQNGGNRSNHQQPRNGNDLRSYQDGYRQGYQGFRNTDGRSN